METKIYRTPKTIKAVVELEGTFCGSIVNGGMKIEASSHKVKEIDAESGDFNWNDTPWQ